MNLEFVNLKECGVAPGMAVARLAAWHYEQGRRVLIQVADDGEAASLDGLLWTFDQGSFVPHATGGAPDAADEPVLIAAAPSNQNNAEVLIMTHPPQSVDALPQGFGHVILLVPANDGPELQACREVFRQAREGGFNPAHTTRLPI